MIIAQVLRLMPPLFASPMSPSIMPTLFKWEKEKDMVPCMLNSNYQLVRNVLSVGVTSDKKASSANGHAVLIYDERNPAFQSGGKGFNAFEETRQALREPALLRKCS